MDFRASVAARLTAARDNIVSKKTLKAVLLGAVTVTALMSADAVKAEVASDFYDNTYVAQLFVGAVNGTSAVRDLPDSLMDMANDVSQELKATMDELPEETKQQYWVVYERGYQEGASNFWSDADLLSMKAALDVDYTDLVEIGRLARTGVDPIAASQAIALPPQLIHASTFHETVGAIVGISQRAVQIYASGDATVGNKPPVIAAGDAYYTAHYAELATKGEATTTDAAKAYYVSAYSTISLPDIERIEAMNDTGVGFATRMILADLEDVQFLSSTPGMN
jgi:hypothetical protein